MEVCLVSFSCVQKSVVSNLAVNNILFRVSRVIIIKSSTALLEHDIGTIVKVHVDGWLKLCIDGNNELARHCGKLFYVHKVLFIVKHFKW